MFVTIDIFGITEKFNVYVTLANKPRTKNIHTMLMKYPPYHICTDTERQTDGTENITSTANAGGKKEFGYSKISHLFQKHLILISYTFYNVVTPDMKSTYGPIPYRQWHDTQEPPIPFVQHIINFGIYADN